MGVQRSRGSLAAMESQAVGEERARRDRHATDSPSSDSMAKWIAGALAGRAAAVNQGLDGSEVPASDSAHT